MLALQMFTYPMIAPALEGLEALELDATFRFHVREHRGMEDDQRRFVGSTSEHG